MSEKISLDSSDITHQFYGFHIALYLFIGIVDSFRYTYLCGSLNFNINLMLLNV